MKYIALLASCLLASAPVQLAHAARKPPRKIAVAQFDAPSGSEVRKAVLATLSDHSDIEVVALDDIRVAAKRVKVDPMDPAGRAKISAELGIEAWIDGKVDDTSAELTLTGADGTSLVQTEVKATTHSVLAAVAGERMWAAMGPRLSEHERVRRALLDQAELARAKIEARQKELARLRSEAQKQKQERLARLDAERELARKKQSALMAELTRQQELVRVRRAQEQAEAEEVARAAAAQQQRQLQREKPTLAVTQAPAWETQRAYTPGPAGISPATQRWLQNQQAQLYANPAPPPNYAANGGMAPASPSTQRWLSQQQAQ